MFTRRQKKRVVLGMIGTLAVVAMGMALLDGTIRAAAGDGGAVSCPGLGRTVTILLTLSEPGYRDDQPEAPGPVDYMGTLLDNSVRWAGKDVPGLRVLVVRDDNHHDEWKEDTDNMAGVLSGLDYDVTLLDEPPEGLPYEQMAGYDVVLLSNPGWPVDDLLTVQSLYQFFCEGGGVILQGDDITYSDDPTARGLLQVLTGLLFVDSGVVYPYPYPDPPDWAVWHSTDGMWGDFYTVTIADSHPVTAGLGGVSFMYGDDIDETTPAGATALAEAAIPPHPSKPAIAVREAAVTIDGLITCKEQCFAKGCIDSKGIANSLDQKLNAAKAAINRNQPETAVNILRAFIHELDAQSGKHVSPRCAQLLTIYAEQLIGQQG